MKIAIMQPYLFPYIGYYQLISTVDALVIFDDVNFIKKGWINRNRILLREKEYLFTLPLEKASQNKLINQIGIVTAQDCKRDLLDLFRHAYRRAPEYEKVYPLIREIILNKENILSKFVENSLRRVAGSLGIKTQFLFSSSIEKTSARKGKDKIIEICRLMHADEYINPIGGTELYDKDEFTRKGIKLSFLKTKDIIYPQFKNNFVPNLSIIDVLMFNPNVKVIDFLDNFELI